MEILKHQQSNLANQELAWFGTDSEELYQKNLAENFEKLKQYNWIDQKIIYKFNRRGFRADEFTPSEKSVVFIGCSHTLGVGLPIESTWPYIISSELNLKNYNLGIPGASNDTAFRLANYFIPQLMPDVVIFLSSDRSRVELHTINQQIKDINAWNYQADYTKNFMKDWLSNDINTDMNYLKNTLAIKQICNEYNIKYLQEEFSNIPTLDKARDLQHFGITTNQHIAKMFLSRL